MSEPREVFPQLQALPADALRSKPTTIAILDEFSQIVAKDMDEIDTRIRIIMVSSHGQRLTEDEEGEISSRISAAIDKLSALNRHIRGAE